MDKDFRGLTGELGRERVVWRRRMGGLRASAAMFDSRITCLLNLEGSAKSVEDRLRDGDEGGRDVGTASDTSILIIDQDIVCN